MKNTKMLAKDILISLANKLPENLVLDPTSDQGKFSLILLLQLSDEDLLSLKQEAAKDQKADLSLFLYQVSEKDFGKKWAIEITDSKCKNFDLSKVVKVVFNGNTVPYAKYADEPSVHYVSATLVVKE